MQNLDFGPVELPDLDDTEHFPTVAHAPLCVDDQPFDSKSCHATPLTRVRQYAYPTEELGRLQQPRPLHPVLPPFPPTQGTHCATITQDITAEVGDAAQVTSDVTNNNGDACRPKLIQHITFPCTTLTADVDQTTGYPSELKVDPPTNNREDNKCEMDLQFHITFPTDGGSGFEVGTVAAHKPPFDVAPCGLAYLPGAEVPVVDVLGVLGPKGAQIDPAKHEIVNGGKQAMIQGDTVMLERAAVQPGGRTKWTAV